MAASIGHMNLVTIERVPLLKVGTWAASTGETTITRDDLDSILEAHESGELNKAVIKIGHVDPRFSNPDWDGEPAYGQIDNLSVDDADGGTLYGDYVNVPEELAEKIPSAYPQRSVEISWGVKLKNATGKVGKTFGAVLTGLALLGATSPAVKGLADVHAAFSDASAEASRSSVVTQFSFTGGHTSTSLRRALQEALDGVKGDDRHDFWLEDFDDKHLWFASYAGQMYQRAYSVSEGGSIAISDEETPVVEKRVFEPITDTAPVPQAQTASAHSGEVSPREGVTKAKSKEEVTTVALLEKYRKQLGLPDTATADDILAALDSAQEEGQEDAGTEAEPKAEKAGEKPAEKKAEKKAGESEAPKGESETAASTAEPTPSVTVSASAFSEMQSTVSRLAAENKAFKEREDKERRDGIISSALSEGRLHPTETKSWREALDSAEEVTVGLLSARQPVFPVSEFGSDVAPHAHNTATTLSEAQIAAENKLFGIGE